MLIRRRFASWPVLNVQKRVPLLPEAQKTVASESVPTPRPASVATLLTGRVNLHHRGFGFVTTPSGVSYYMTQAQARPLVSGDQLEFSVSPETTPSASREVKKVRHVKRQSSILLGVATFSADAWQVCPDDPCFIPLLLRADDVFSVGLQAGEVLAVRIPAYEGKPDGAACTVAIDRVLGQRSRPGFAIDYALVRHGFQDDLPAAADAVALSQTDADADINDPNLLNLTAIPFVTIDGESTRDFDDAVHAIALDNGWQVRIAIADVSWYVQAGSALDVWAAERCTTVYLPGRTVPMLPNVLSTGRCSLTPGAPKRAVVLTLQLDAHGVVTHQRIERSLIESAARLTYTQVANRMDINGRFKPNDLPAVSAAVNANLTALCDVYRVLAAQRTSRGKLEFDEPEPTLVTVDGVVSLVLEARTEAHKLVEEFMLLANQVAAGLLMERYGFCVARHQPPPTQEDWQALMCWAEQQGHQLPEFPSMRALVDLVLAQKNVDDHAAASHRIRACMRPALYMIQRKDATEGGHFSLSMEQYTHFTSPIRRYADLLVHRLLLAPDQASNCTESFALAQVARCTERAQASRLAERLVWDGLKLQSILSDFVADTVFLAKIVRITARGLRVVILARQCAAWLPARDLRANGFQFENDTWCEPISTQTMQEGFSLSVSLDRVVTDQPAHPELQVKLLPPAVLA